MNLQDGTTTPPSPRIAARALRLLMRGYPLYSGYGRLANTRLCRRMLAPDRGPHWTRLRGGQRIAVPTGDWVGRTLFYLGDLDPKLSWICSRILRRGDTALDVGANVGAMSLAMRSRIGAEGAVHAFEPQPRLVELLQSSVRANEYSNVTVHACALGRQSRTMEMFVPADNFGAGSFRRRGSPAGEVLNVPVVNAADYLERLALSHIRLLKLDVEGYEADVVEGGTRYFEVNRPDAILFEMNDYVGSFESQPVVRALARLDYSFYGIPAVFMKMGLYEIRDTTSTKSHDVLALARGDELPLLARRLSIRR